MRRAELQKCLTKRIQFLRDVRSLRTLCSEFRELLCDVVEFFADRRQLEPQLVQLPREIELLLKARGRCFNAWIHCNGQRLREGFASNCQGNRVIPRGGPW